MNRRIPECCYRSSAFLSFAGCRELARDLGGLAGAGLVVSWRLLVVGLVLGEVPDVHPGMLAAVADQDYPLPALEGPSAFRAVAVALRGPLARDDRGHGVLARVTVCGCSPTVVASSSGGRANPLTVPY